MVILRRTRPDLDARVPTALACRSSRSCRCSPSLYLMLNLPAATWVRFVVWMVIGLVVYFVYGHGHSRLGRGYVGTNFLRTFTRRNRICNKFCPLNKVTSLLGLSLPSGIIESDEIARTNAIRHSLHRIPTV